MIPVILEDVRSKFNPRKIAGLKLWLDANKITGLSDGDPVTTWSDLSGNGKDATQAAGGAKPTYKTGIQNGRSVVRFDGSSDFMETAAFSPDLSQPNTIIIVMNVKDAEGDSFYIFDGIDGTKRHAWLTNATRTPDGPDFYAGAEWKPDVDMPKNAWHYHGILYNGASSEWWLDGVSKGTGNTGSHVLSGLTIARNETTVFVYLDGDIGEILVYDGALSSADRGSLDSYLSGNWGI